MRAAFFVGAGLCGLSFISVASATTVPPCTAAQLQIYEVAVDMPGMMKSHSLYGIINHSQTACMLQGTPQIWGLAEGKPIELTQHQAQVSQAVIVQPLSKKDSVLSTQLVWFGFDGNAASDGAPFKTIRVILPGLPEHPYTVSYSGYSTAVYGLTPIQQGAQNWLKQTQSMCPGFYGKTWPVFFTATADCG